jgi:hypothetical protein
LALAYGSTIYRKEKEMEQFIIVETKWEKEYKIAVRSGRFNTTMYMLLDTEFYIRTKPYKNKFKTYEEAKEMIDKILLR